MEAIQEARNINPGLGMIGILPVILDARCLLDKELLEQARKRYGELMFFTVVRRRSRIKEMADFGIEERTREDRVTLEPYKMFADEMKNRLTGKEEKRVKQ